MPPQLLPRTYQHFGHEVVRRLLRRHRDSARVLPWRSLHGRRERAPGSAAHEDPYVVLVSEVMLQQTQASRVADLLPAFLARFPNIETLAVASRAEVLKAWRGLGYNSRGLRLHELAQLILREHGGRIPDDAGLLRRLPGIGRYTAGALACFAFGRDNPVVDTNVARVLSRVFFRCHSRSMRMPVPTIERLDAALVPSGMGAAWHEALMDHGATVCTARDPRCGVCHLRDLCLSADPPTHEFFEQTQLRGPEPTIADVPRRIWRGRILDWLRRQKEPGRLGDMIVDLTHSRQEVRTRAHQELKELVAVMASEGLLSVDGTVAEGEELSDAARVQLGSVR